MGGGKRDERFQRQSYGNRAVVGYEALNGF
jgi:hypothetical protein